jgi:hypothetical protein
MDYSLKKMLEEYINDTKDCNELLNFIIQSSCEKNAQNAVQIHSQLVSFFKENYIDNIDLIMAQNVIEKLHLSESNNELILSHQILPESPSYLPAIDDIVVNIDNLLMEQLPNLASVDHLECGIDISELTDLEIAKRFAKNPNFEFQSMLHILFLIEEYEYFYNIFGSRLEELDNKAIIYPKRDSLRVGELTKFILHDNAEIHLELLFEKLLKQTMYSTRSEMVSITVNILDSIQVEEQYKKLSIQQKSLLINNINNILKNMVIDKRLHLQSSYPDVITILRIILEDAENFEPLSILEFELTPYGQKIVGIYFEILAYRNRL